MRPCKAKLDFTDNWGDGSVFECQLSGKHREHFCSDWHNNRLYELRWTDERNAREKICEAWERLDCWWRDLIEPVMRLLRRLRYSVRHGWR